MWMTRERERSRRSLISSVSAVPSSIIPFLTAPVPSSRGLFSSTPPSPFRRWRVGEVWGHEHEPGVNRRNGWIKEMLIASWLITSASSFLTWWVVWMTNGERKTRHEDREEGKEAGKWPACSVVCLSLLYSSVPSHFLPLRSPFVPSATLPSRRVPFRTEWGRDGVTEGRQNAGPDKRREEPGTYRILHSNSLYVPYPSHPSVPVSLPPEEMWGGKGRG